MYLRRRGHTDRDEFAILTAAGPIHPRISGPTTCTVAMAAPPPPRPTTRPAPRRTRRARCRRRRWRFQHVSIGNPQCAIADEDLEALDLPAIGPAIERHPLFPNRTNVSWYRELEPGVIAPGSSSGASARRCPRAPAPAVRPSHTTRRRTAVDRGSPRRRRAAGRAGGGPTGDPDRLGGSVFAGTLADDFRKELDEHSERLERIPPYLFAQLERKIDEKRAAGIDVISLAIGDPDTPTFAPIVEAAQRAIANPQTHQYPSNRGREEFREAVAGFYGRRFGVPLDIDREVIPAIGARNASSTSTSPSSTPTTSRSPQTPATPSTPAARCSPAPPPR